MNDQVPYNAGKQFGIDVNRFHENPESRCPVILLLDTSSSMSGAAIKELNDGIRVFRDEISKDELAAKRVQIAVITFGPVRTHHHFIDASLWQPPTLEASGDTPMGRAILDSLDLIRNVKEEYRRAGIQYYRPWILLVTDGSPTDDWRAAASAVKAAEEGRQLTFFPIGVQEADMATLAQFSSRAPARLKGLQFRELFLWLSASMRAVSHSQIGGKLSLPPPTGWADIEA